MSEDARVRLVEFVRAVTRAMGLALEVRVEEHSDHTRLVLEGRGGEVLIRRKGAALDALQHVVNTAFRRTLGGRHLVVDCMGFRRAKEIELREMAKLLAERAKATGEPQEVGPLNPYLRRIVHLAVAEDPAVTSESIGDAFLKTVVITARKSQS
jgi:spoIIIJ-associated protein